MVSKRDGHMLGADLDVKAMKITKAQKAKARLFVCGRATDATEAKTLLDMLGLI